MELYEFVQAAKAYRDLGHAITEQLDSVMDTWEDTDPDEFNPNALRIMIDELLPALRQAGVDNDDLEMVQGAMTSLIEGCSDEAHA